MVSKCQPGALPTSVRPFCSGGNRLLPGLSDSIYLVPVRALEALSVPDIELPVDKYIAPTPGTALELPHYHVLTPLEILECAALPEGGHSRTLLLMLYPPVDAPVAGFSASLLLQSPNQGHARSGLPSGSCNNH